DELKNRIQDEHAVGADHWVYNDITTARALAEAQGKPLFVTFRCVPCKDCKSFDAEVANGSDAITELARREFISVRQVEMKNVDLTQFQFDHDLNWAAMFINADGTVYARYGTQSSAGPDAYNSVEGLKRTMQQVLKLHANYPANKAELVGKRAKQKPYKTATEMPGLPTNAKKFLQTTTRRNCIHCHMIHDAENVYAQKSGTLTSDMLWRYPLPDNIGLRIDASHGTRIAKVLKAAESSGLKDGAVVTHMNGQVVTSIADMQWVLHGLNNEPMTISLRLKDGSRHSVSTAKDWKRSDISWRGSIYSLSPVFAVWAPPLPNEKRQARGVTADSVALEVRWINRGKASGRKAFEAGLREGDVLLKLNDQPVPSSPQKLQTLIKLNHKVGEELRFEILRDGRRKEIVIELVE
ncbi:MAG: Trx7/PDZ domain-containing (seleno)protein, partial [Planctomycetaceae bacterium]